MITKKLSQPYASIRVLLAATVSVSLLAGCAHDDDDDDDNGDSVNAELRSVVDGLGLTGDPSTGRDLPTIEDPLAQLGKKLFFTKSLGGEFDAACVTCHHPALGGGDGLALPVGVDAVDPNLLGPGRIHDAAGDHHDMGPTVPRNAPTTFNLALWDSVLFHDGRVESLDKTPGLNGAGGDISTPDSGFGAADAEAGGNLAVAQTRFPVTSPEEMRNFDFEVDTGTAAARDHLAARLGDYGEGAGELSGATWLAEFQTAFSSTDDAEDLITYSNIALAMGEYERSQIFVDTPWKHYVEGDDDAISEEAKEGALLFYGSVEDGGANCASCHEGDFFTDEGFHNLAMPQVGRGKGVGTFGDDDFGRQLTTGDTADAYKFRTPGLINVEVTGPYTHAGAYADLEDVIRHHLDPAAAVAAYDPIDYPHLNLAGDIQVDNWQANTQAALDAGVNIETVELTDEQVGYIKAFLMTLTDPCVKDRECLAPWVFDADNEDSPDANMLTATGEL